jgi:hypothetical protein
MLSSEEAPGAVLSCIVVHLIEGRATAAANPAPDSGLIVLPWMVIQAVDQP